MIEWILKVAPAIVVCAPLGLLVSLALPSLLGWRWSEPAINRQSALWIWLGLLATFATIAAFIVTGTTTHVLDLGDWISINQQHFHFHVSFIFDRLSLPFLLLCYVLCGTVGAFTGRYLHREPGYLRFYLTFALFTTGIVTATLAGTIEVLFFGWELVGLSSALLIAFFQERLAPVRNGLRAWIAYRIADAAFVAAAILMHHVSGGGDFSAMVGHGPWPTAVAHITSSQVIWIGLLLIVAAAGKSALVPFSGWLPRAMEGPTSSSAIFYGALSVRLGAYLLLRISPILEVSFWLSGTVVGLGLVTAVHAAMVARVQSDVKTALAYASLTQVGLIVAEIGFGFRYLALAHILGHASLRTLQFLRAPTLLHDYHQLENSLGSHLPPANTGRAGILPEPWRWSLYRLALDRWNLDPWLDRWIGTPFKRVYGTLDRWERRWCQWMSGELGRDEQPLTSTLDGMEELKS